MKCGYGEGYINSMEYSQWCILSIYILSYSIILIYSTIYTKYIYILANIGNGVYSVKYSYGEGITSGVQLHMKATVSLYSSTQVVCTLNLWPVP